MLSAWTRPLVVVAAALAAIAVIAAIARREHALATSSAQPDQTTPDAARGLDRWVCDMHCEPGKSFEKPGICAVCRMALRKEGDVGYTASFLAPARSRAGAEVCGPLRVLSPVGLDAPLSPLLGEDAMTLIVSQDLSWFEWRRSLASGPTTRRLCFEPPTAGTYRMFVDVLPAGQDIPRVASALAPVPGPAPEPVALKEDYDVVRHRDAYEFRLRCNGDVYRAGTHSLLRIGVDLNTRSVDDLEHEGAARGRMILVSADFKHVLRAHPLSPTGQVVGDPGADTHHTHADMPTPAGNAKPGDAMFHAVFPEPGLYRAFALLRHRGRDLPVEFTIDVRTKDWVEPVSQ